eukprot:GHRQ01038888.1.p1 GENE.GHRQ01038888.1~~GHRQ01038888.1.p1  ORF type:complete len:153 (-),score=25.90 GHRQ01038888.1:17-475(-)
MRLPGISLLLSKQSASCHGQACTAATATRFCHIITGPICKHIVFASCLGKSGCHSVIRGDNKTPRMASYCCCAAGGEAPLEFFCNKSNCSLFVLGSHSKKRPHNITLGRLYDFHLYDALELGVEAHRPISSFRGAGTAQVGNKVSTGEVGRS